MLFSSVLSLFALAAGVHAHGNVKWIKADGKTYKGPTAGGAKIASPIRRISTTSPYKDPKGSGITCGRDSQLASMVASITAGSVLELAWEDHPGSNWQHNMGPLITYMAKVPAGQTADKFDASKGDFFKVAQVGQSGKGWTLATLMTGATHKVTVPKNIANGDYIMRHEIIALHLANSKGGAEFYTSCFQLRVTGGTGSGAVTPTARFPGAYSANDAGIFTPNVFNPGFKYAFPGPAMPTFAKSNVAAALGSGSGGVAANVTSPSTSSTAAAASGTPTGKHCKRSWSSRMEKRLIAVPASQ